MPPVVIDVNSAEDSRDVVHRAVQALVEGKLAALPTETVYGLAVSALKKQAVLRLMEVKGRPESNPLALAIKSADEAEDYVPDMPPLGVRLARRCWPGPVTLVFDDNHPDSALRQLPKEVQQIVCQRRTIGLRVSAHPLVLEVSRLIAGPLALTSANRSGQPDLVTGRDVLAELGDDVDLVLDDGRTQYGQSSTVVRVHPDRLEVLREGIVSQSHLKRLASLVVVVVCTGNTCRSPMAAALLRHRLAERLGCKISELEDRGVVVASAGLNAYGGGSAATEAIQTMSARGLDLSDHVSQPLTDRLARHADLIFTMTRSHREMLLAQWPEAASRTHLLCVDGRDVTDPIGGSREIYAACAKQIDAAIAVRVAEIDLKSLAPVVS
ncbi:MAG: threonylcarbamoyl-AMP synthase [Planctomycetes bacterium]|nr:threonylcarbamoyl-AMP synthase [Planctomycetota bacterium]